MEAQLEGKTAVFKVIPGSSQSFAIDSRCHHTLYYGTRGPGKTITQLMRFRRYVGVGYGQYWRGIIFDVEFKNLSDLVAQSKRFFPKFFDGARFKDSANEYKWVWPTGETLMFRHAKKKEDYDKFHGHEYPFIGWNELTKQPTADLYDLMMSTNRSSFIPELHTPHVNTPDGKRYLTSNGKPLDNIPLEVFSTTNPNGAGHNWVKRRFITCAQPGEVVKRDCVVFDPKLQEERVVTKTQIAIFGSYKENIYLSADYIAELDRLCEGNENLRKAWLEGDWDFTAGGAIDDVWDRRVHILPRFPIPPSWHIDRAFDWGSTHPFSVGWWAEANGEDVTLPDGSVFCPPKGTLIQFAEWYGTKEIGSNKGLRLGSDVIAEGILEREHGMIQAGFISYSPQRGPADNQIRNCIDKSSETIENIMADKGVRWLSSDKSPGSRIIGLELLRDRLRHSVSGEGPGIYFMQNCQGSIATLPPLQMDEKKIDDVDTNQEDHVYDMVRYRVLQSANRTVKSINIHFPH